MTKVFISWSGELSKRLAEAFRDWLPRVLQSAKPYFTPADIEKGARWSNEVSRELESSNIGVVFLTKENLGSAWLIYESGALSKQLDKAKVCPVVIGVSHNDLPAPLRQFQVTEFNYDDFAKLLRVINATAGENKLTDTVLMDVFDTWWPKLKSTFEELQEETTEDYSLAEVRDERSILEEILELTRLNNERAERQRMVPPDIVDDLASHLLDVHAAVQGNINPRAALVALSKTRPILEHLARNSSSHGDLIPEDVVRQFLEASFEYDPPPKNEDLPF